MVEQVPKQDYNLWISMLYMERNDAKRRPRHDIRLLDNHWTEITFRQHKPRSQAIFCVGAPGITHAGTCGCVNVIATWSGLLLSHRRCGSVSSVANRHKYGVAQARYDNGKMQCDAHVKHGTWISVDP